MILRGIGSGKNAADSGRGALFDQNDMLPELHDRVNEAGLDTTRFTVVLPCESGQIRIADKHSIILTDDKSCRCEWRVQSLRELFRGNKTPPSLEKFPPEYVPVFAFIERHTFAADAATGGRLRDQEMEEIYRTLRRRPDGRSLGPVHDHLWQVAATVLALRPLSQAEHEEVFGRLARSCSTFGFGATSRNYFTHAQRPY